MQAMEPIIDRMQDKMLVRQQAMNASMTNSFAMLGTSNCIEDGTTITT